MQQRNDFSSWAAAESTGDELIITPIPCLLVPLREEIELGSFHALILLAITSNNISTFSLAISPVPYVNSRTLHYIFSPLPSCGGE